MSTYLINSNTSVVGIKTNTLSAGEHALVYLPPSDNIGHLVTIRDTFGYLSSPQSIIVSTTDGASIRDGISSIKIQQGYGYMTLRSEPAGVWAIVDQSAFSSPTQVYDIRGVAYGGLDVIRDAYFKQFVSSTGTYLGTNSEVFSTVESTGPIFAKNIAVDSFSPQSDTFYQFGSAYITGSTMILSTLRIPGSAVLDGNITTLGSLQASSSLNIAGPLVFSTNTGKLSVRNNVSTNYRLYVNNTISTGGTTSISSICRVQHNLYTSTLLTTATHATLLYTNELDYSANVYIRNRPDITLVAPGYTDVTSPVIEMNPGVFYNTGGTAATYVSSLNTIYTQAGNFVVGTLINAAQVTQVDLNKAAISNPNGSLEISSITTSNINLLTSNDTTTIPLFAADNAYTNNVEFRTANFLQSTTVNRIITDTFSTNSAITSRLSFGNYALTVSGLGLSSMFVSTAFLADNISSFSAAYSIIDNTHGNLYTSNITASTIMTSTLYGTSYISAVNPITMETLTSPVMNIQNTNVRTSTFINSLDAYGITIGAPYPYSTLFASSPYMTTSTTSGVSTDTKYEYINGLGTIYDPIRIRASYDRNVNIFFNNVSSLQEKYLTIQYTYQNGGSATGSAGVRMVGPGFVSTIIEFNASPISTIRTSYLSNFAIDTNLTVSTYSYYFTGPKTYEPPSTTVSRNIMVTGGVSQTTTITYSSDGGGSWLPLKFTPLTSSCLGVAWGSNKWLATGESATANLIYSYNATNWYPVNNNIFTVRGRSVAWNGSLWLAAGEGTNTLAYSSDGINWTGLGTTIFTVGRSVAWNGSVWVAAGQGTNTLAYSANGSNWTGLGTTIFTTANSVAWGGRFVAAGGNTLAYSDNGITWSTISSILTTATAVAWNGSRWLAGGGSDVATSSDGLTWSKTPNVISNINAIGVAASNWVVTGDTTSYSADGVSWTPSGSNIQGYALANREALRGLPSLPSTFLPVYAVGVTMSYTTNGSSWTPITTPFTETISCMAWNGSMWIAGGAGTYQLAYSTNGVSWTPVTIAGMTSALSVAWGLGGWIACGTSMTGFTYAKSPNGITWTPIAAGSEFFPAQANGIAWAENVWVAVGADLGSGIIFSLDGIVWVAQQSPAFTVGRCVANNGDFWIAGGDYSAATLAYSYDGAVWVGLGNSVFSTTVSGIAWGNNLWVAVGSGTNSIAFSYDGISWIGIGTSIFTNGLSVTYNGTQWFATGNGPNTLATSFDGVTWIPRGSSAQGTVIAQTVLPNSFSNINEPVQIRWDLSGLLLLSPSSLEKPVNSVIGWDTRGASLDGYVSSAQLTFRIRQTSTAFIMGFSELPRNGYTAINYGFYVTNVNTLLIYELGVQVASYGAIKLNDNLNLTFTGTNIVYSVNSTVIRTVARSVGNPLYLSSSFRSPGCRIDSISFQQLNQLTSSPPVPDSYSYSASIKPVRDDLQYITYSMQAGTGIAIGNWQFDLPISGNLSSLSSVLYADFLLNSTKLFSTNYIVAGYLQPSTYTVQFNVSTYITTTPADTININLRTQRGTGETYFYNAYSTPTSTFVANVRNNIYNLSSVSFLEFYHTSFNSGIQTSEAIISLNNVSTVGQNYVDSNLGVNMNKGYMVWPNRLAGLTINNRFNDMQTRDLTYTGSLYNASDSNLKSDIEYVETDSIYEKINRLPLRRYGFTPEYLSTFQPTDRHQIGIITSEVAEEFPEIVNSMEPSHLLSTLNVIDRGQFKFAHLGATQRLIQKVSSLAGEIRALQSLKI